jgi:hypothetical protein
MVLPAAPGSPDGEAASSAVMGDLASASGYWGEAWIASLRASAISLVLICVACASPAMARGGHIHGMGGFGLHDSRENGLGLRGEMRTPAYVMITVSKITDAELLKTRSNFDGCSHSFRRPPRGGP